MYDLLGTAAACDLQSSVAYLSYLLFQALCTFRKTPNRPAVHSFLALRRGRHSIDHCTSKLLSGEYCEVFTKFSSL